jgi:FixJ family two-component response regulator
MARERAGTVEEKKVAPIFILADDDPQAGAQLIMLLSTQFSFIPVSDSRRVLKTAKDFAITAIFLADGMVYPQGGSAGLLQRLLDEVGKPVVILSELWSPEVVAKWKRMGAEDCLPHPTRSGERVIVMSRKISEFALRHAHTREGAPGGE